MVLGEKRSLGHISGLSPDEPQDSSPGAYKKRKLVFDGVLVPTLRSIRTKEASSAIQELTPADKTDSLEDEDCADSDSDRSDASDQRHEELSSADEASSGEEEDFSDSDSDGRHGVNVRRRCSKVKKHEQKSAKALTEEQLKEITRRPQKKPTHPSPDAPALIECGHDGRYNESRDIQYHGCAYLARLGLHWSPLLSAVVQPSMNRIMAYTELKKTISDADVELLAPSSPSEVLAHILATFEISEHDTPKTMYHRIHLSLTVKDPVPGLAEPIIGYRCPQCLTWSANWSKHKHQQKLPGHENLRAVDFLQSYAVLLYQRTDLRGYRISLPQDWQPSVMRPAMMAAVPSPSMGSAPPTNIPIKLAAEGTPRVPHYVEAIGWLQYTDSLNMRQPAELTNLVASPFVMVSNYSEGTIAHALETFLVSLYRAVIIYISEADKRLSQRHVDLRKAVCYAKGVHISLQDTSIQSFASIFTRILSLPFRFALLQGSPASSSPPLGQFQPLITTEQRSKIQSFVDDLKSGNSIELQRILEFIHAFSVTMFTTDTTSLWKPVETILEQALLAQMFTATGWLPANRLINILRAIKHISRCVLVNSAFMGDFNVPYKRISVTVGDGRTGVNKGNAVDEDGESEEEDGAGENEGDEGVGDHDNDSEDEDEDEGDENQDHEVLDLSSVDSLLPQDNADRLDFSFMGEAGASEDVKIIGNRALKFLKTHSQLFSSTGNGQWKRVSSLWTLVSQYVSQIQGSTSIVWSNDARSLSFSASYEGTIVFDLPTFGKNRLDLSKSLMATLLQAFPEDYPIDQLKMLSISSFSDDHFSSTSLFDRADNKALLTPLVQCLVQSFSMPGFSRSQKIKVLKCIYGFLQSLVCCFYGTNGVPPRAWQTALFTYASAGIYPRNLYVDGETCYFGNPRAKQKGRLTYSSFWALPDDAGLPLLIYLGVFRPAEIILAESVTPKRSADEMKTYIFTRPYTRSIARQSIVWTGEMVNLALSSPVANVPVEARTYRHFCKAVLRKHLQQQMDKLAFDPKDQDAHRRAQLLLSRTMQFFFGIVPAAGEASLCDRPQDETSPSHVIAQYVARHLVVTNYKLGGLGPEIVRTKVAMLTQELPFLYGSDRVAWCQLGDAALRKVTCYLMYGGRQPWPLASPSYLGISEVPVAEAATRIFISLQEWSTGIYRKLRSDLSQPNWLSIRNKFLQGLKEFRVKHQEVWFQFSKAVFLAAQELQQLAAPLQSLSIVPTVSFMPVNYDTIRLEHIPTLRRQHRDIIKEV